ncbi:chitinase 2-like [Abrus precatorius]|uniref:Chitinase 2-like n=1 Tax=Abrus precatorius TaxID=3816 RepID=A0A8B8K5E7_ABRPR|nr:chitinase 2-like [Abrus precatorius]
MSVEPAAFVQGEIFREYIGAKPSPKLRKFPVEIINPKISEFHFILAFATDDYDPTTGRGKGNFRPSWNVSDFSAVKIKEMKAQYRNVKVVISIGGRGTKYPFNPEDKLQWIHNAKKSLKEILEVDYKDDCGCVTKTVIDGVDINYEHIESDGFVECIGEIIEYLKRKGMMVSIAPSDSTDPANPVLTNYKNLYKDNKEHIDWVDYQFYDQTVSTTHAFVNLYRSLSDFFSVKKLLAGYSTDPEDAGKISQKVFFEGCEILLRSDSLPGIFVWDANDSKVLEEPYYVEIKAQQLLTKSED